MTLTRRNAIAGGATAVVAGLVGCVSSENDAEETVVDEQQAEDIERLSVEVRNGNIRVRSSERDTVSLTGQKRAPNAGRLDDVTVETEQTGQTLTVSVLDGGGPLTHLGPTPEVDIEVDVPASLTAVEVDTTNGDIVLQEAEAVVAAEATKGDITAEIDEPEDVSAETTNGDVELTVPSTIEPELSLDTTHGSLDIDGLQGYETTTDTSLEATLGSGTCRIECETVNGDVAVQGR